MPAAANQIFRGFLLGLVLALTQADEDFGKLSFCTWSASTEVSKLIVSGVDTFTDSFVTTMSVHQRVRVLSNDQLYLSAQKATEMIPKLTFKGDDGTVWKEFKGQPVDVRTQSKEPDNERNEEHVETEIVLHSQMQAVKVGRMMKDSKARRCRARFFGKFIQKPHPMPGCQLGQIRVNFDALESDIPGIVEQIYLNGRSVESVSKSQGEDPNISAQFDLHLHSSRLPDCSLVKHGDFCDDVLAGRTELVYIEEKFVKRALAYFAVVPTCLACLYLLFCRGKTVAPMERSPLKTILTWNIYGAVLFLAIAFLFLPAHEHATYYSCGILWEPSYMTSILSIIFYVCEPFILAGSVCMLVGLAAVKAGFLDTKTLRFLAIIAQCLSALYQIWNDYFAKVLFREVGQRNHLTVDLTIVQSIVTYILLFGWKEEEDLEAKRG